MNKIFDIKTFLKNNFTPSRLKKFAAPVTIVAIFGGCGAYFLH